MGSIKIKGGTPRTSDTLCRTCSNSHTIKGFSASEEEFFCRLFYIERRIPFAVFECSKYEDVRLASRKEMEEIAWFLATRKAGRSVGFVSAARFHEIQEEPDASSVNNDTTESAQDARRYGFVTDLKLAEDGEVRTVPAEESERSNNR